METIAMLGETISHYKIIEKLGEGGMGIVYKAQDLTLDRLVALKFLPQDLVRDPEAKERFVHEAQAASALDHANICTVHEFGQHDGQTFMVMGYYEGETLKRKIDHGALPLVEAVNIICQVAEGLAKAHEAGIVHRDIKPANIIVTKDGVAKILDFGLAKVSGRTLHTKSGTTLGTVAYMSPEQARGEEIDARSDVWSLGVTMYELLSGKRPFESGYEQAMVYLILNEQPEPLEKHVPEIAPEVLAIVNRALEKRPDARYASAGEMLVDLRSYQETLRGIVFNVKTVLRWARTPRIAIPTFAVVVGIALLAVWFFNRQAKIRWAREEALPEIERLISENDVQRNLGPPYKLAEAAEQYIPDDPKLNELLSKCSVKINITTDPPGAHVYAVQYDSSESAWQYLGVSPLKNVRMPFDVFRWRIEKEGYETVMAASSSWDLDFNHDMAPIPVDLVRKLDKKGSVPPGMVHIPGTKTTDAGELGDFFADKYEVTNKQYKEFMNAGGYDSRSYWKNKFIRNGKELTWEQAMKEFVDQTGQHAPVAWQAGSYPDGQEDYPVAGISWYEAAAYAEFAGKKLLTAPHWWAAQGGYATPFGEYQNIFVNVPAHSNFGGNGPARVGAFRGMATFGTFDMAGNVREWCWNETPAGRLLRGGAWGENAYMFGNLSQAPAMDRSAGNGVRCAIYPDSVAIPDSALRPLMFSLPPDARKLRPVSDAIFRVYKEQFTYDRTPLNARIESKRENAAGWVLEHISLDAAYGRERFDAYLFLPTNAKPPYQTVVYFPSGDAGYTQSSKDIEHYYEFPAWLSLIVKSGRAVLFPIYKGTFERQEKALDALLFNIDKSNSRVYTEFLIKMIKDLRRSIDYLNTRQEIDNAKLAYFGMSWGGALGAIIPAVEERLKVSVLLGAGIDFCGRPEANSINYVTRVKIPTLMLVGKYDVAVSSDNAHDPMYELLGTPQKDKQMITFETGHVPPRNEVIKETLNWLDRYLGPVKK
jgi:eukaryotic-like serine/threonine-protein kinase